MLIFDIKKRVPLRFACLLALLMLRLAPEASAQPAFHYTAAFTYQGRLTEAGNPVSGTYDMQFKLYDQPGIGTGTQQGGTIANSAVQVANGVFSVTLDFGPSVFDGTPRYLEISERPGGSTNPYNVLATRQPVNAAPYAVYSLTAGSASGVAAGAAVTSLNTLHDAVTLAAGSNVTITPSGNTLILDAAGAGGSGIWSVSNNNAFYNAGNVGIGTAGPLAPLEVSGIVRSARTNGPGQYLQLDGGDPFSIRMTAQSIFQAEKTLLIQNLSGETTPGANNSIQFAVGTSNAPSTKMTITKDGNVIMNPVGGGTMTFGTPNFETGLSIEGGNRADIRFDDNTLKLAVGAGPGIPSVANGIAIDTAGNVGIGTGSPATKLQVEGFGVTETAIKSFAGGAILSLQTAALLGGGEHVWTLENGLLNSFGLFGIYDRTAAQARLAITPVGDVGIGTVTPDAKLNVETAGPSSAVHGKATGLNTGVFGESTSPAVGTAAVYGKNLAGAAFTAEGNATQNRDKGGWVKAMLFVEATGDIIRCYNGLTGASFQGPPSPTACGFSVNSAGGVGLYVIDFGFQVDDRFVSVTPGFSGNEDAMCTVRYGTGTSISVYTSLQSGGGRAAANFTIIVY